MLRFRLVQLHVPSLGRYLLPLPKLSSAQLTLLSRHLAERGYEVRQGSREGKLVAHKGAQRLSVDGALGLAASSGDLLDALAPAVPSLLAARKLEAPTSGTNLAARYFSLKSSRGAAVLQLFPRMESLRTWTCLRMDRLCGLTPDEAQVLRHLLRRASRAFMLDCVTDKPRQGSRAIQVGRRALYKSRVPVAEFLSSLATLDHPEGEGSACYLPRDSVIRLRGVNLDARITQADLGQWCS